MLSMVARINDVTTRNQGMVIVLLPVRAPGETIGMIVWPRELRSKSEKDIDGAPILVGEFTSRRVDGVYSIGYTQNGSGGRVESTLTSWTHMSLSSITRRYGTTSRRMATASIGAGPGLVMCT